MSISDTSMSGLAFADHEIQWLRNDMTYLASADAGPSTTVTDENEFDVTERGLDNDELAELVYLRADMVLGQDGVSDQSQDSFAEALTGWGANVTGGEFLTTESSTGIDVDDSGTDDFTRREANKDENGLWVSEALRGAISFEDNTNGNGSQGVTDRVQVAINYRDVFGSGPYLDSTDDIVNRIRLEVGNMVEAVELSQRVYLVWNVQTVEGGRATFAGPS